MTIQSKDGKSIIVKETGLNISFLAEPVKKLNKADFKKAHSEKLHGYTDKVYDDIQAIKKSEAKAEKADKK